MKSNCVSSCAIATLALLVATAPAMASSGRDIDIIPTPKRMEMPQDACRPFTPGSAIIVLGADAAPLEAEGADQINQRLREFGYDPLPIKKAGFITEEEMDARSLIFIGTPADNPLMLRFAKDGYGSTASFDLKKDGYAIRNLREGSRFIHILAGYDPQACLYAAVTFKRLIFKDGGDGLKLAMANIDDWPDCRYRPVLVSPPGNATLRTAKPYLDWAADHKFSVAHLNLYRFVRDINGIPTEAEARNLKEVNDYAHQKGVQSCGHLLWNTCEKIQGGAGGKGCSSGGYSWCLSNDERIKEKADKLSSFIKESRFDWFVFHFRDGSPTEYWGDRCAQCRKRFGDDRAAADANYINIFYDAIKKRNPAVNLIFVVEPYYGNLSIPQNKPYRDYFAALTKIIPEDVYLVNASITDEAQKSWKEVVRQPICEWRNFLTDAGHAGRDFTTEPLFAWAACDFTDSRDIPFGTYHIGYDNAAEAQVLFIGELLWNKKSLSSSVAIHENALAKPVLKVEDLYEYPTRKINGLDFPHWLWEKGSTSPSDIVEKLLPRLCREAYGEDAAPLMTSILKMGVARRVLLMDGPFYHVQGQEFYGIVHDPEVIKDHYEKARKAVAMLEEFKAKGGDFKPGAGGFSFFKQILNDFTVAGIGGYSHYEYLMSRKCLEGDKIDEAKRHLQNALENLNRNKDRLGWDFKKLKNIESACESLNRSLSSMSVTVDRNGLNVAIYNPSAAGGKTFGEQAVFDILRQTKGISPKFISNIEDAVGSECLVVPDCKKFSAKDGENFIVVEKEMNRFEAAIRDYVMKDGKGVLLYHDSVGHCRFPLGRSVFPELCVSTKRVDSDSLRVLKAHPVVKGYPPGGEFRYGYFDHISMKAGEKADVLAVDGNGDPVIMAGELERGRVVLNGTITLPKGEGVEIQSFDRDMLVNSILWLSKRK